MRLWAGALAAALVVAGCSATITGTPVKAPGRGGGDGVDVALLATGNYPTTPRAALEVAGSPSEGATLEAHRIAGYVTGPWEADTSLTEPEQINTIVVKSSDALNDLLAKPTGDGVVGHHFVTGFSSARHNATGRYKALDNFVLRFASAEDAAAAAHDMAAKSTGVTLPLASTPIPTQPFAIPRYPGSAAVSFRWPASVPLRGDVPAAVLAFTAHGPYVLCQSADADTADNAAQLIATTLDLQQPMIDKFTATPLDQLAQLPIDPSGLFARTLPQSTGDETVNDGVYDPRGALQLELGNPVHLQALFQSVGLQQAVETAEVRVYQTPDAEAAHRVVADYAGSPDPAAARITGMPQAKCFKEALGWWCVAAAERYAFVSQSPQEIDLHQRMSAQYRMLTGK